MFLFFRNKNLFIIALLALAGITLNAQIVRFADVKGDNYQAIIQGPCPPPPDWETKRSREPKLTIASIKSRASAKILDGVPTSSWVFGCSATSAGMIMGYYDRHGYPNMYAGSTNNGVAPLNNKVFNDMTVVNTEFNGRSKCPYVASMEGLDGYEGKGHVDDFYYDTGDEVDPYYGNWEPHCQPGKGDCLADFMGTSQYYPIGQLWILDALLSPNKSAWYVGDKPVKLIDGASWFIEGKYDENGDFTTNKIKYSHPGFGDLCNGMKLFSEWSGYTVDSYFNQRLYDDHLDSYLYGFTFDEFKAEIDAGRPLMIQLMGHSMCGIGYDSDKQTVFFHNTWDHDVHEMNFGFGSKYSNMSFIGVSCIRLGAPTETTYSVEFSSNDDSIGEIRPSGKFRSLGTQKISAVGKYDKTRFIGWETSGAVALDGTGSEVTATITGDGATVKALFEMYDHIVTFMSGENGSVTGETTQKLLSGGSTTEVKAVPNDDYYFTGWTGDHAGTENPLVLSNVTKDMNVTANFAHKPVVTFSTSGNGSFEGSTRQIVEYDGSTSEVKAVPSDGKYFIEWTGDHAGTENPLILSNVTKDMNVTAVFASHLQVEFKTGDNGSVSGVTSQSVPYDGSTTSVSAVPSDGYYFTGWTGDHVGPENPLILSNVTKDATVTANFAKSMVVTFSVSGEGAISGDATQAVEYDGSTSEIKAVPTAESYFTGWTGDYEGTENPLSIAYVRSNMTITANFALKPVVSFSVSGNGTISGDATQTVEYDGSTSEVKAVPTAESYFTGWTGGHEGTENPLTIAHVRSNMTITANFALKPVVSFSVSGEGSLDGAMRQIVEHDGSATSVMAVPAMHVSFVGWTGDYEGTDNPLVLSNVTKDMSIVANFEKSGARTVLIKTIPADGGTTRPFEYASVEKGGSATITATPADGMKFSKWIVSPSGSSYSENGDSLSLQVDTDSIVTAVFENDSGDVVSGSLNISKFSVKTVKDKMKIDLLLLDVDFDTLDMILSVGGTKIDMTENDWIRKGTRDQIKTKEIKAILDNKKRTLKVSALVDSIDIGDAIPVALSYGDKLDTALIEDFDINLSINVSNPKCEGNIKIAKFTMKTERKSSIDKYSMVVKTIGYIDGFYKIFVNGALFDISNHEEDGLDIKLKSAKAGVCAALKNTKKHDARGLISLIEEEIKLTFFNLNGEEKYASFLIEKKIKIEKK